MLDGSSTARRRRSTPPTPTLFLGLDDDGALVVGEGEATPGAPLDATRGLAGVRLDGPSRAARRRRRPVGPRPAGRARSCWPPRTSAPPTARVQLGVAYAKERQAFGRAIGSYQAVKHMLVDAWVGRRPAALAGLVGGLGRRRGAGGARRWPRRRRRRYAAEAFERAAETLIQVHGGIGFTWEHDAHLYWRRAKVDRLLLGDEAEHLDTVARLAVAGALGGEDRTAPSCATRSPTRVAT